MEIFNVISNCDICNEQKTLCREVITITKDGKQKVETWCEKCYKEAEKEVIEERARQDEEAMYEVYKDIIRSSY